jgi:hypothetical protein
MIDLELAESVKLDEGPSDDTLPITWLILAQIRMGEIT